MSLDQYNYYEPDTNKVEATLEVNLDNLVTDVKYPVAEQVEDLIQKQDFKIIALNEVALTLKGITRLLILLKNKSFSLSIEENFRRFNY